MREFDILLSLADYFEDVEVAHQRGEVGRGAALAVVAGVLLYTLGGLGGDRPPKAKSRV